MQTPFIVGITGGSASGKTTFLQQLLDAFGKEEICLISQDNYYRPRNEQPKDEQGIENFDTPQSIDFEAYTQDIKKIKRNEAFSREEYTFNNPNAKAALLEFKPAPIVVVEGIFVFYFPELVNLLDLKVFIDAKEHIKIKRRIIRDKTERGYDLDDVLYRYENHVMPTYEKYIEPFKYDADVIIPNNLSYKKGLEVLIGFLKSKLA